MPGIGSLYLPGSPTMRRSLSGARWTPASLSGLVGWWDAGLSPLFQASDGTTAVTADADPVGYWGDLSSSSKPQIQATSSKRGTYKTGIQNGLPMILMDTVDDRLVSALNLTAPYTIVVVEKDTGNSGNYRTISATENNIISIRPRNSSNNAYVNGQVSTFRAAAGAHVGVLTVAIGGALYYVDGTDRTTTTGVTGAWSTLSIGGVAEPAAAYVGTVLAYSQVLSTTDRQTVEAYLKARWGTP